MVTVILQQENPVTRLVLLGKNLKSDLLLHVQERSSQNFTQIQDFSPIVFDTNEFLSGSRRDLSMKSHVNQYLPN
jgi:hypothetical protein